MNIFLYLILMIFLSAYKKVAISDKIYSYQNCFAAS